MPLLQQCNEDSALSDTAALNSSMQGTQVETFSLNVGDDHKLTHTNLAHQRVQMPLNTIHGMPDLRQG